MYNLFLKNNNGKNTITMPGNNQIAAKIEQIIDIYIGKVQNNLILLNNFQSSKIINSILYEILLASIEPFEMNTMPSIIREACKFIEENYYVDVGLEFLAKKYNVNKYYFHKLFKYYTKTTPHDYLINCRINRSKELLKKTDLSITDIGFQIGFNSASHFISVLKKMENNTPNQYRKMWKK